MSETALERLLECDRRALAASGKEARADQIRSKAVDEVAGAVLHIERSQRGEIRPLPNPLSWIAVWGSVIAVVLASTGLVLLIPTISPDNIDTASLWAAGLHLATAAVMLFAGFARRRIQDASTNIEEIARVLAWFAVATIVLMGVRVAFGVPLTAQVFIAAGGCAVAALLGALAWAHSRSTTRALRLKHDSHWQETDELERGLQQHCALILDRALREHSRILRGVAPRAEWHEALDAIRKQPTLLEACSRGGVGAPLLWVATDPASDEVTAVLERKRS